MKNLIFHGEGASIVLAGHNFSSFLANLPKANIGDKIEYEILVTNKSNSETIEYETNYGTFNYEIYDTKIINEEDVEEVPIQKEKEILMIYTCYPINNIGHASQRYVVYASLIKE